MTETDLQKAICKYIRLQYPDVIFTSESSGVRVSKGQAIALKAMRSESGLPDLMVFEPKGVYKGLFLELKVKSVWLKDESLSKNKHVREQAQILKRLNQKGYLALFACGFDEAKSFIDGYLGEWGYVESVAIGIQVSALLDLPNN